MHERGVGVRFGDGVDFPLSFLYNGTLGGQEILKGNTHSLDFLLPCHFENWGLEYGGFFRISFTLEACMG